MAKGHILDDAFEQLAELGVSTAKATVKQVAQTFNPVSAIVSKESNESNKTDKSNLTEVSQKGKDHTPLDFKKLQEKFQDKEKVRVANLRNRLFQIVRREDEKSLERKKMSEEEKKRQEEYEKQEKKRQEQQQVQPDFIPSGKAKRGFMSKKKSSEQQHVESKPASGKQ